MSTPHERVLELTRVASLVTKSAYNSPAATAAPAASQPPAPQRECSCDNNINTPRCQYCIVTNFGGWFGSFN